MRASLLIAAHNEGDSLWKTIRSCVESCAGLDYEIVLADDASTDGSIRAAEQRYPQIRVSDNQQRRGASPTKHLAALQARGDVLVFLDGHCNPEPGAVRRLVEDVEELAGQAIITPRIPALSKCWTNRSTQVGRGYRLGLETFDCGWLPLEALRVRNYGNRKFYESPALIGCALAIARELYDELHGFDPHMFYWGVEDLDFGLRSWLLGHPILHDPEAVIGHRFRQSLDNYDVPFDHLVVNQLRMARKNFTQSVWSDWLERCRQRSPQQLADHPEGFWARVWQLFQEHEQSAESERARIHARRKRDEFWYAERFGLSWPKLGASAASAPRALAFADQPSPSPSPPPDCGCSIQWANGMPITNANRNVLPGAQINLKLVCTTGTPTNIKWNLPGDVLKDYLISETKGTPVYPVDSDLAQNPVKFYWVDVSDGRPLSVTFQLGGTSCTCEATFNVKDVIVEYQDVNDADTPDIGFVVFDPAPPPAAKFISLRTPVLPPGTLDAGIIFTASVGRPRGFGFTAAKWQFGQLIDNTWTFKAAKTGACTQKDSVAHGLGPWVNDQWPYVEDSTPKAPPYDDGPVFYSVQDSPASRLAGSSQVVFSNYLKMYIMFLPAADPPGAGPSIWESMRSVAWNTSWCGQIVGGKWTIVSSSQNAIPWDYEYSAPAWTGSLRTERVDDVGCPGDCR